MFLLLILVFGFYLYNTDDSQKLLGNSEINVNNSTNELKEVIDYRYASGEISTDEYNKLKALM